MHPEQASWVVRHRAGELQRTAAEHRLASTGGPRFSGPLRRRAGWWLVGVGLTLAVGRGRHRGGLSTVPSAS